MSVSGPSIYDKNIPHDEFALNTIVIHVCLLFYPSDAACSKHAHSFRHFPVRSCWDGVEWSVAKEDRKLISSSSYFDTTDVAIYNFLS